MQSHTGTNDRIHLCLLIMAIVVKINFGIIFEQFMELPKSNFLVVGVVTRKIGSTAPVTMMVKRGQSELMSDGGAIGTVGQCCSASLS